MCEICNNTNTSYLLSAFEEELFNESVCVETDGTSLDEDSDINEN